MGFVVHPEAIIGLIVADIKEKTDFRCEGYAWGLVKENKNK